MEDQEKLQRQGSSTYVAPSIFIIGELRKKPEEVKKPECNLIDLNINNTYECRAVVIGYAYSSQIDMCI